LSTRYPLTDLEEALAGGIILGHEGPEMPQFQLDAGQIEALIAYLLSQSTGRRSMGNAIVITE
jgi:cytochrome c